MNRFKGDLIALVGEEEGEKKKKSVEITWNESSKIDSPVSIQSMHFPVITPVDTITIISPLHTLD